MFYATAEQHGRRAIVAGPYLTHGAAMAASARCARLGLDGFRDVDPFDVAFGTARDRTGGLRRRGLVPRLNRAIAYAGPGRLP